MNSPTFRELNEDIDKLCALVDQFAAIMKDRLIEKARAGYSGWDQHDFQLVMQTQLGVKSATATYSHDPVESAKGYLDCANLAMFLWNLERKPRNGN